MTVVTGVFFNWRKVALIEATSGVLINAFVLKNGLTREPTSHKGNMTIRISSELQQEEILAIFDALPIASLVLAAPDWRMVAVNQSRIQVTGVTLEGHLGKRLFDVFPNDPNDPEADGVQKLTASLERVLATRTTDAMALQKYAVQKPDGGFVERWWSPVNTPVLNERGEVILVIHQVEDVTEVMTLRGEAALMSKFAQHQQAIIDRVLLGETALRQSEERNRRIVEGVKDHAILVTNENGLIVDWAPGATEMFGWSQKEIIGKSIAVLYTLEDQNAGVPTSELHAARSAGFASAERWHIRRDGSRFYASGSVRPLHGGDGLVTGFIKIAQDETERREAEDRLRASEARLRQSERHLDALVRSSSEARFSMNADWSELSELAGGDFIPTTAVANRDWLDLYIPSEDRNAVRAEFERAIQTRSTYDIEHRVHRADGTIGWAQTRAVPLFDADSKISGWLGAASDITPRKRAEAALQELNASLEQEVVTRTAERNRLWHNSLDLLAIAEPHGRFIALNPAWTSVLGWAPCELIGRTFSSVVHPDDLATTLAVFAKIVETPLTDPYSHRIKHKEGGYRWIAWNASLENGRLYSNGRDITTEKEKTAALVTIEEALRQSQKMEAIGQLTGGVAHDFNNLLTVIKSSCALLRRPELTDEKRTRYVGTISTTVDRAAKLTSQLLAFARRQALEPEVFAVCDAVRSIGEMMDTLVGARIQLELRLPAQRCFVRADRNQFDTALVNMAVNARDAMDGAGKLTIAVEAFSQIPGDKSHVLVNADFMAVTFIDTGTGIAPENLEKIFEPFFTTKSVGQGTGLGLSQVFGFAKQSGGEMRVSSELGNGAEFTLYLPRTVNSVEHALEPDKLSNSDRPIPTGHRNRVLMVEDNVDVGTSSQQTLQELGFLTNWCINAEDALKELTNDATRFDVVFSDVMMPGMSGLDLAQEIAKAHPHMPIVLTSGYSHILAKNGTLGFELLQKPYSIEDLTRILHKAVSGRY